MLDLREALGLTDEQPAPAYRAPQLDPFLTYKGVYALCTTRKDGSVLKATHYACCLVQGVRPVWGVWTVQGKFLRFYPYKHSIAEAYPKLVWRRKMATWSLTDITDKSLETRRDELSKLYSKPMPKDESYELETV